MLTALLICGLAQEPIARTPAAYWFPAAEGIEKWLPRLADEERFDTWIADPTPNELTRIFAKGKVKLVAPADVYNRANDKWRSSTIEFIQGKISPSSWIKKTTNLKETYHYLTTPKTPGLRAITSNLPNGLGALSGRAVFGETLLCYWPGKPCFYSTDLCRTSYFPENKQHESWILAMNDFQGPMLSLRADHPELVKQKPKVLRADTKPGMLIYQQKVGKQVFTFFFNNGMKPQLLPVTFKLELAIMPRGLDVDTKGGHYLLGSGTMLTIDPPQ
ncbi:MAG: hypothetical protein ABL949_02850 [Fimbriimonadaceae bacterium]